MDNCQLPRSPDPFSLAQSICAEYERRPELRNDALRTLAPEYLIISANDPVRDFCDWDKFTQWPQSSQW